MSARLFRILSAALAVVTGLYFIVPTMVVFWISFTAATELTFPIRAYSVRWYERFFDSTQWAQATITSVLVAVVATSLVTVLGSAMAVGLARGRFKGKKLIVLSVLAPVLVPPVVIGLGMYVQALKLQIVGTFSVLVMAHAALCLPYVVLNVVTSLRTTDETTELAARSCGAHPIRAFVSATLPVIVPGLLGGAVLAFAVSWEETVISSFLATSRTQTLPVVILQQTSYDLDPTVAAAASIVTVISFAIAILFAASRNLTGTRLRKKKNELA